MRSTYLIRLFHVAMPFLKVCILFPVTIAIRVMGEKTVKAFPGSCYLVLVERNTPGSISAASQFCKPPTKQKPSLIHALPLLHFIFQLPVGGQKAIFQVLLSFCGSKDHSGPTNPRRSPCCAHSRLFLDSLLFKQTLNLDQWLPKWMIPPPGGGGAAGTIQGGSCSLGCRGCVCE